MITADTITAEQLEQLLADHRRYQRIRILGAALGGNVTEHLKRGTVATFTVLDDYIDSDIAAHPSRGEYDYLNARAASKAGAK